MDCRGMLIYIVKTVTNLEDGETKSYLVNTPKTMLHATQLLQDLYEDANAGFTTRVGSRISNPKWLDDEHTSLEISECFSVGWLEGHYREILSIQTEWESNLTSNWLIK